MREDRETDTQVTPYSTIPITCSDKSSPLRCGVPVRLITKGTDVGLKDECDFSILQQDWNQTRGRTFSDKSIALKAKKNPFKQPDNTTWVLQFDRIQLANSMWDGYQMQPIIVSETAKHIHHEIYIQ